MADPSRHDGKLDLADEILDFVANNPEAEDIREKIRNRLDLIDQDLEDAAEVITDFRNLIRNQKY